MKDYLIEVKTEKNIGSEATVRSLLTEWCKLDELRPELFDLGEPIRRRLDVEGIESAVSLWIDSGISPMLKRVRKPKYVVDLHWRREKGLDPRPFPWGCTVWLHRSAGDRLALELLRFLIQHFEPVFGSVSTEEDDQNKHFITFTDLSGRVERYVGRDVVKTLPGIYWTTYFGPWAVEKIGKNRFVGINTEKVETVGDGYLVQTYDSASDAGSDTAREAENRIISHLGKEHFFDKTQVDVEMLKSTPEEAVLVEERIRELKERKGGAK